MKGYDLILSNNKNVENSYEVRLDYNKIICFTKSKTIDEFIADIKADAEMFNETFEKLLNELTQSGIMFQNASEVCVWQDPYKNIVISNKVILDDVESFGNVLNKITDISSKFVKEEKIFLRIINYATK